jgi:hypothetical protein
MVLGMETMTVRGMSVFRRLGMRAVAMFFRREAMMLRGVVVMLRRFLVVVGDVGRVRHVAVLRGGRLVRADGLDGGCAMHVPQAVILA